MNNSVLLIISMAAALLGGIVKKIYSNKFSDNKYSRHMFNALSSAAAAVILAVWGWGSKISVFTLTLGIVFGIVTALQQIFFLRAMEIGSWSYTSVITALSMLIPTLSGAVIWGEKITAVQVIGIALTAVCFILSAELGGDGAVKKASLRWILYCSVAFVTTGCIGVMQKWHQSTPYRDELDGFLVVAFAVSFLISAAVMLYSGKKYEKIRGKGAMHELLAALPLVIMLSAGVFVALNNKFNLYLSGVMDSALFFPVVNGGGLVLTTLSAVILFREKLTVRQWIGLSIGAVSVILLCNPVV